MVEFMPRPDTGYPAPEDDGFTSALQNVPSRSDRTATFQLTVIYGPCFVLGKKDLMSSHKLYAVEEPIKAHKSLRGAAWVGPEQFFIQAFVGMISNRHQCSGIGENYAQPRVRQHRVDQVQPARSALPAQSDLGCGLHNLRTCTHLAMAINVFPWHERAGRGDE
jgi:hypothetical protein